MPRVSDYMYEGTKIRFARPEDIEPGLKKVCESMSEDNLRRSLRDGRKDLAETMAMAMHDMDMTQPFLYGTRHVSLMYMSKAADQVDYRFTWDKVKPAELEFAYRESRLGRHGKLVDLVERNLVWNGQPEKILEYGPAVGDRLVDEVHGPTLTEIFHRAFRTDPLEPEFEPEPDRRRREIPPLPDVEPDRRHDPWFGPEP